MSDTEATELNAELKAKLDARRVQVLSIGTGIMPELLGLTRFDTRLINVPEGAEVVRQNFDFLTQQYQLIIQHPSFEPVEFGSVPPLFVASCSRTLKPLEDAK